MTQAPTTRAVPPDELLTMIGGDRSDWHDAAHEPDTVTMRRMIFLADYAVANPERWALFRLRLKQPHLTQQQMADRLKIGLTTLKRYLAEIRLPKECEMYDALGSLVTAPPYDTNPTDPFFES